MSIKSNPLELGQPTDGGRELEDWRPRDFWKNLYIILRLHVNNIIILSTMAPDLIKAAMTSIVDLSMDLCILMTLARLHVNQIIIVLGLQVNHFLIIAELHMTQSFEVGFNLDLGMVLSI